MRSLVFVFSKFNRQHWCATHTSAARKLRDAKERFQRINEAKILLLDQKQRVSALGNLTCWKIVHRNVLRSGSTVEEEFLSFAHVIIIEEGAPINYFQSI